ncbi:MAG TPA: hypothetical protein PLE45_01140 [Spirochaetota bacterium]|mgnify:CR=1 FL=1|nr:hypothetical protein [Spirochaetota bacterium]HOL56072.1 hypothetical protein [Spirochaetota bacterium]HPP03218.1 hypothetical protein [Spirochaetota bacterium]
MKLTFNGIKFKEDSSPIVVFENREKKKFQFPIEIATVRSIVEFLKTNEIKDLKDNLYFTLINKKRFKIEHIVIREYRMNKYFGDITIRDLYNNRYNYSLTIDDIILFSLYFNIGIELKPSIFYDFLDNIKIKKSNFI